MRLMGILYWKQGFLRPRVRAWGDVLLKIIGLFFIRPGETAPGAYNVGPPLVGCFTIIGKSSLNLIY